MMDYYAVTFQSTHAALQFEKMVKAQDLSVRLIPVPRQISASCGLAGRVFPSDLEAVLQLCETEGLVIEGVHPIMTH